MTLVNSTRMQHNARWLLKELRAVLKGKPPEERKRLLDEVEQGLSDILLLKIYVAQETRDCINAFLRRERSKLPVRLYDSQVVFNRLMERVYER